MPIMKSILIVDDKPEIAKIIMIYLSSSYQVVYMENPVKAISWMNEGNIPDGIISDLKMCIRDRRHTTPASVFVE